MEEEKGLIEEKKEQNDKVPAKNKTSQDKKIKNLISLAILLGGLFVGSIFVDVVQLVRGGGFSPKKLANIDIFNFRGKTWVAYNDPIVTVKVVSDQACENCNPDKVVFGLHQMMPTVLAVKVDQNTQEGIELINNFNLKTLPSFIFSQEVEKTDFFKQNASVLDKKDNSYTLRTAEVGIPTGKYIKTPTVADDDIKIGDAESKVKIFLYSDFQCPFCKTFHTTVIKKILTDYKDKTLFIFRNYPLNFHNQAEEAALASECANEQGKFLLYANKLFDNQGDWTDNPVVKKIVSEAQVIQKLKTYAGQIGLKTAQFNECLDSKKYADKIQKDKASGANFGISGTPSMFVNDSFADAGLQYNDIKKIIDDEMAK
ncbi:MAG: thioredoxin domain-containing protein [bacterium]|nr:thioredoxin domain-containing protein [bacterium]